MMVMRAEGCSGPMVGEDRATSSPAFEWLAMGYGEEHRCLFRHLALAAEEIAREDGPPGGPERYAAAAARFRDLASAPRRAGVEPVVVLGRGGVPLSDLLASAWLHAGRSLPGRGLDFEMLEAARELLHGLTWKMQDS